MAQPKRVPTETPAPLFVAHRQFDALKNKRRKRRGWGWLLLIMGLALLAATALLFHPVSLHWNASATSNPGLVYDIYRAPGACSANAEPVLIGSTMSLSFWDPSIKLGTFCYSVRARIGTESSPESSFAEVQIRPSFRH